MQKYILSLDSGNTSHCALLFNRSDEIATMISCEFKQICLRPGWVEHDPEVIWASQLEAVHAVLTEKGITADQVEPT
jgi:glycerol kinase